MIVGSKSLGTSILDSDVLPYYNFLVDKELALEIGRAVLDSAYGESPLYQLCVQWSVIDYPDANAFAVHKSLSPPVTGGDFYVILDKSNGAILKFRLDK